MKNRTLTDIIMSNTWRDKDEKIIDDANPELVFEYTCNCHNEKCVFNECLKSMRNSSALKNTGFTETTIKIVETIQNKQPVFSPYSAAFILKTGTTNIIVKNANSHIYNFLDLDEISLKIEEARKRRQQRILMSLAVLTILKSVTRI